MAPAQEFIATGRRKTSVARIRMTPGSGKIDINGRSFEDYFPTAPLQNTVLQPLQTAKLVNAYDLSINATGGGATGQAGAVRLAKAEPGEVRPIGQILPILRERGVRAVSGNGVLGDPSGASAAEGERLLARLTQGLNHAIDRLLDPKAS